MNIRSRADVHYFHSYLCVCYTDISYIYCCFNCFKNHGYLAIFHAETKRYTNPYSTGAKII